MRVSGAIPWVWSLSLCRRIWPQASQRPRAPRALAEFGQVNSRAGIEPLRPELSGLRLREPGDIPRRVTRLLVPLRYRWCPSREYRRRQAETERTNSWVKRHIRRARVLPPILLFPREGEEIAPCRVQPVAIRHAFAGGGLPLDLRGREDAIRLQIVPTIGPVLPAADPEYFATYRHLLPRQYRHFLRHSPYPRIAVGLSVALFAALGSLWMTQWRQAGAVAAGQVYAARHALIVELGAARRYGVDGRSLRPFRAGAARVAALSPPTGITRGRARLTFYRRQARDYAALLAGLRRQERRAFRYWTWKEGITYAALMEVAGEARAVGRHDGIGGIPACATPACFRRAVANQTVEIGRLRRAAMRHARGPVAGGARG